MTVILYLARSPLTATYKLQAMHAAVRIKIINYNLKVKPAAELLDMYTHNEHDYTRSELASLAHSFYTCMKLQIN